MFKIVVGVTFFISSQVINWLFMSEANCWWVLTMIMSGSLCAGNYVGEGIGQLMKVD